ncbi:MAG: hypothetical protein NVS3B16_21490 [Vulcanimicrobiaceae bacterium]
MAHYTQRRVLRTSGFGIVAEAVALGAPRTRRNVDLKERELRVQPRAPARIAFGAQRRFEGA